MLERIARERLLMCGRCGSAFLTWPAAGKCPACGYERAIRASQDAITSIKQAVRQGRVAA
jgi:rubrerythrin